jgi:transposase, IS5 family
VEQLIGKLLAMTFVDMGCKAYGVPAERSRALISGTPQFGYTLKRHLRRRSAMDPETGHTKGDGLIGRNFLKGMQGGAINAILRGAGPNLRKILGRSRVHLSLLNGETRAALQAFGFPPESIRCPQHSPEDA